MVLFYVLSFLLSIIPSCVVGFFLVNQLESMDRGINNDYVQIVRAAISSVGFIILQTINYYGFEEDAFSKQFIYLVVLAMINIVSVLFEPTVKLFISRYVSQIPTITKQTLIIWVILISLLFFNITKTKSNGSHEGPDNPSTSPPDSVIISPTTPSVTLTPSQSMNPILTSSPSPPPNLSPTPSPTPSYVSSPSADTDENGESIPSILDSKQMFSRGIYYYVSNNLGIKNIQLDYSKKDDMLYIDIVWDKNTSIYKTISPKSQSFEFTQMTLQNEITDALAKSRDMKIYEKKPETHTTQYIQLKYFRGQTINMLLISYGQEGQLIGYTVVVLEPVSYQAYS